MSVNVYLVQHAEAVAEERDPDRPLSKIGHQHAETMADLAGELDIEVHQIHHSGKTRAEQTAEILGSALSPVGGVMAVPGLGPVDAVKPIAETLDETPNALMLVGHLPFMERLSGQLVVRDADLSVVAFTNAGIVCLERGRERWQVTWIATPEIAALSSEGEPQE